MGSIGADDGACLVYGESKMNDNTEEHIKSLYKLYKDLRADVDALATMVHEVRSER